jgi:hypothetical protein
MTNNTTPRVHPDCKGIDMPDRCPFCDAYPDEICPLVEFTGLEGAPISAGTAADSDPEDGVCEACQ